MKSQVKPIPDGYHTVTPVLMVNNAAKLIDFLTQAFGARERERYADPDGKILHAEVTLGDSIVQLSDATGEWKPVQVPLLLYVTDTDATYRRALKAGATSLREPMDAFYGDRTAGVKDAFGNSWWIATTRKTCPAKNSTGVPRPSRKSRSARGSVTPSPGQSHEIPQSCSGPKADRRSRDWPVPRGASGFESCPRGRSRRPPTRSRWRNRTPLLSVRLNSRSSSCRPRRAWTRAPSRSRRVPRAPTSNTRPPSRTPPT